MTLNSSKQVNCAEHIALACSAINLPLQTVKTLFHSKELYEINYSYKEEKDFLLEIRFETATLTCLFDENNSCEGAFLFLDDLMDITHYIEYCNKTYPCDFTLKGWILNNCLLQITTDENKECSLLVMPINQSNKRRF